MDKRDVLISDVRVTALAETGQYVFEWVDEDQQVVSFLPEESDYTEISDDVEKALQANGLRLESGSDNNNVSEEQNTTSNPTTTTSSPNETGSPLSEPEPIGPPTEENDTGDDSSETDAIDPIEPTNPQSDMDSSVSDTEDMKPVDSGSESEEAIISNPNSDTESDTADTESESQSNATEETEYISFMVRMTDPEEREQIVKQLKKSNPNAAKKLQLTGPFQITYKVQDDGLEVAGIEDLGIGDEAGNTG